MYYESDADLQVLADQTIAIIGYGSQGHAHALNLKDSGLNVVVGLYEGSKSWQKAEADGLTVKDVAGAAAIADVIMILLPDEVQKTVYATEIAPICRQARALLLLTGLTSTLPKLSPAKCGCVDGSPQLTRALGATGLYPRTRGSRPVCHSAGCHRQGTAKGNGVCQRHRGYAGRDFGNFFSGRDGNGFVWRAGGAVWWLECPN